MKEKMILDSVEAWKYSIELNNFRREQDRRDRFAAAALTGLLANGDFGHETTISMSVNLADLTIAALGEKP